MKKFLLIKKLLPGCLLLSGCYAMSHYENYYDTHHHMVLLDSAVVNGSLVRIFKCQNDCGYYDTFPDPAIARYIRTQKADPGIHR